MSRGNLPKAYLRVDPNIDQTHPDNLDGFVRLLCAANRQPVRGTFRSRAVLEALLGKAAVTKFVARKDIVIAANGTVTVPGWDGWQEGDFTVAERMQRLRAGRNSGVTPPSPERDTSVTDTVTPAVTLPSPPSEAARQQGSKASDVLSSERTARAPDEGNDPFEAAEAEAVDWLRRHKCRIREGDGYHQRLIQAVEHHGVNALIGQFDRLARAGTKDGDTKGFLFRAIDLLDARGRPNLRELEDEERAAESARLWDARVTATQRRARELHPELYEDAAS